VQEVLCLRLTDFAHTAMLLVLIRGVP
jgi:hypothetical protein